jgi:hypothetical protein
MNGAKTRSGRGAERIHSEMRAKLIFDGWDEDSPVPVILRDISVDGAGLIHSIDLPRGRRLVLQLPALGGLPMSMHAHVVSSRKLAPGQYRIGLQFDGHESVALDRLRDALLF